MNTVKLILQDEVNCKFEGLEIKHRRDMIKSVTLYDPTARFTPAGRLGRWDGSVPFMQMGGNTYINLLPTLLAELDKYNVDIEIEDQRIAHDFVFDEIDENLFSDVVFGVGHHMEGKSIVLREHQVNAINALLNNQHGILQACTGAGKTLITAGLSKVVEKYGRTIVIVPSKDLVQQTFDDYDMVGLDAGMLYGDKKEFGHKHTITTWQSLNSLWKKTKKGEMELTQEDIYDLLDGVVCVMVDEAHGASGESLLGVLQSAMKNIPIRWGMTGTIPKDKIQAMKIKCNLGEIVYEIKAKELQEKGILSTCNVTCLKLKSSLKYADYQDELKFLTTDRDRMEYLAGIVQALSESGNTLVLVDRIESGELLCEFLGLPRSAFVSGSTKKKDRATVYGEYRWEDNKIGIATFGVASTGISISRIYNLVILEAGKSFIRTIQSIGRGLRVAEDKNHVEIFDVCGSNKFSAKHLRERIAYYKEVEYPYGIIEIAESEWNKSKKGK